MNLHEEYFNLTEKYTNKYGNKTVLLMQVGAFYEVYGLLTEDRKDCRSKIYEIGELCDIAVVEKKQCIGNLQLLMCGFRDYSLEKYVKKIQNHGYSAVVYSQKGTGKNVQRELTNIYSPGSYISTDNDNISNYTTCIWVENIKNKIYFGISNIDVYTGKVSIFEYNETNLKSPTIYDELERMMSIYIPNEIIVIFNIEKNEIKNILSYLNLLNSCVHYINLNENNINTEKAEKCQKQNYQKELMHKYYKIHDYNIFIEEIRMYEFAFQSLCFLLDFVNSHNNLLTQNIKEPIIENNSEHILLANHTLKQLNILNNQQCKGTYSSILSFLNKCITPMGKREFKYNLLNPIHNIKKLNYSYECTEYFLNNSKMTDFLVENLKCIKDIEKMNRLIYLKTINPYQLYNFYTYIEYCEKIINYIKINNEPIFSFLSTFNFSNIIENIKQFNEHMKTTFNINFLSKPNFCDNERNVIFNKNIYPDLDELLTSLNFNYSKLYAYKDYFTTLINTHEKKEKSDVIKVHVTEKTNLSLLTTKKRGGIIVDKLKSFKGKKQKYRDFELDLTIQLQSPTNTGVSIVNDDIKKICYEIHNQNNKINACVDKYFTMFIEDMVSYQEVFDNVVKIIVFMDCYTCKAKIANKFNYCRPEINYNENSYVKAENIRHCLIEQIQEDEIYVCNDINLDENNKGMLLYGTNAVGKTSLIRSLGICIIMAQSGLYVPCSSFVFSPYKKIFSRILNNDNLFKGLSTFAVEMSELRVILNNCDNNTLILGDELCSGTEIDSAISIFLAGLKNIYENNSTFIFATHLHQITEYDEIVNMDKINIQHLSVIYDKQTDSLLYDRKLKDGPGNNMYGLEVCKSMHLPIDFLDEAYLIREKYSGTNNLLLSKESNYNKKTILGLCEICKKNNACETHHMQYQKEAVNKKIGHFNMNHNANLMAICECCHDKIHHENVVLERRKTTNGYKFVEIK